MPAITIDGRALPFAPGQTVIQVAHAAGIEVPHYCYHPGLSIVGNCRICMVEVQGNPRPQIACKLAAAEGMVVRTESALAVEARAGVMEMLLVNHPLDCPICDQAGECHLQDYSYQFGHGRSRSPVEKTHLPKNVPFGAKIVYDAERCIKCTLCVRFCEEVAGTSELSMGDRGDREIVIMTSRGEFTTPYSMNIVDICPVGALTSRDFRFKSRLWFMDFTPSICTGCARGCNVTIGARGGRLLRMEPRHAPEVNGWWMCDAGRLGYDFVNAPGRLALPRVKGPDGAWLETPLEEALAEAGRRLRAEGAGGDVLVDGNLSLEEMLLARDLAAALGGRAYFAAAEGKDGDAILIVDEKGANARGAEMLGLTRVRGPVPAAVLAVERDANVPAALRAGSGALVVLAADRELVPDSARVVFPLGSWAERDGWLVNCDGIVQAIRRAASVGPPVLPAAVEVLAELLVEVDPSRDPGDLAGLRERLRAEAGLEGARWPPAERHEAAGAPR